MTPRPVTTAPEGWQLVPVEPTEEMLDAAYVATEAGEVWDNIHNGLATAYRAMLSAAPSPSTLVVRKDDSDLHQSNANQQGAVSTTEKGGAWVVHGELTTGSVAGWFAIGAPGSSVAEAIVPKRNVALVRAAPDMRKVLVAARHALILCGFCGPSEHGSGDPEINMIDNALAASGTPGSPVVAPPGNEEEVVNQVNGEMLGALKAVVEDWEISCERFGDGPTGPGTVQLESGEPPASPETVAMVLAAITRAEALPVEERKMEQLGRFGHHPDPAIDFCVEVDVIEGLACEVSKGIRQDTADVVERVESAMSFTVGGDEGAVAAKGKLRGIASALSGEK